MNKADINKLENWIQRKPDEATVLRVSVRSVGGMTVLLELVAEPITKETSFDLAKSIGQDCADWTDEAQKDTTFLLQWLEGERPIGTRHLKMSPLNEGLNNGFAIDGTVESMLASLQAANVRKDEEVIRIMQAVGGLLSNHAEALQATIEQRNYLERENLRLKEALIEKTDDDQEWKKEMITMVKTYLPVITSAARQGP